MLALRWENVDLVAGVLTIRRSERGAPSIKGTTAIKAPISRSLIPAIRWYGGHDRGADVLTRPKFGRPDAGLEPSSEIVTVEKLYRRFRGWLTQLGRLDPAAAPTRAVSACRR